MYLIDTHCHLSTKSNSEIAEIITRAKEHNVLQFLAIGASEGVASSYRSLEIAEANDNIYASVGIHPHDAGTHFWDEKLEQLLHHPKVLAVGETGLDYFKEWSPFDAQRELFKKTISLAVSVKKPLVIHCREAEDDCFQILQEMKANQVGGVFHCYSGSAEFAAKVSNLGFIVSYTGIITFKKCSNIREEAAKIPLEKIMLETDCPYMAPEPHRGKESEPFHVHFIGKKLAEVHNQSFESVCKQTTENAKRLFRFPDLVSESTEGE